MMDIWDIIKKWFEDVILPIDDAWYEDEPKEKPTTPQKRQRKPSESHGSE